MDLPRRIVYAAPVAAALIALGVSSIAATTPVDDVSAVVVALDAGGAERWRVALEPPAHVDRRSQLEAGPWHPPFPDVEIPLLDGGSFRPSEARGEVLLIDFWASWCEPCLREMPRLQALQDEWRGRGLRVITVNSGEPRAIALDFLDALEVSLPAGTYDRALREVLPLRALPTLVLVDPEGRMQRLWNGYSEGLIDQITERVVELLDPEGAAREVVAEVLDGHDRLSIDWARRAGATAGLAIVTLDDGDRRAVVAIDSELLVLDGDGAIVRRVASDGAAGSLRLAPPDAAERLLAFRPGGRRIVRIGDALDAEPLDVPSYVLDLAGAAGPWVATVDGLLRLGDDGWVHVGPKVETRAVIAVDDRVAALRAPSTLAWYGADATPAGERTLPLAESWHVMPAADGSLIAADGRVGQLASGRLIPGREPILAVTTRAGSLVLLDAADGRQLHRSRWKRLGPLAFGDLDGDGVDELLLSAGPRVFRLRWVADSHEKKIESD